MSKLKISDFSIGDDVYLKSNQKLKMVVIQIHVDLNEMTCRWVDAKGQSQKNNFLPGELNKADTFPMPIYLG